MKKWVDSVFEKLNLKMPFAIDAAREMDGIPYIAREGGWLPGPTGIRWWTNGFWPASMWRMYLATGQALYREEAIRAEALLDAAFDRTELLHHDVGFLWRLSAGVHYQLYQNDQSRERLVRAVNLLAARYNPHGFLRAWNDDKVGWAIIDTMMNLSLLYWATETLGDPRYRQIAIAHADTVLAHFMRPDGSVHHIVVFDPETGQPVETPCGQGFAPGSSWSRGQAWAIYGFAISHIHTGMSRYLEAAKRVAHYFIANVWTDFIPACDFRAPAEPVVKDNCAGNIAACGLLALSALVPPDEAALYRAPAIRLLRAAEAHCADWSETIPGIMTMCTGSYHGDERHVSMHYGDYFFLEGMHRLRDMEAMSFF